MVGRSLGGSHQQGSYGDPDSADGRYTMKLNSQEVIILQDIAMLVNEYKPVAIYMIMVTNYRDW